MLKGKIALFRCSRPVRAAAQNNCQHSGGNELLSFQHGVLLSICIIVPHSIRHAAG